DVPREVLPEIVDSSGPCGETADLGWLPRGVPIAGIAGDQQAALFGQACFEPGTAKNTYGTGCFALVNTGERPVVSSHGLLTTIAWRIRGHTTYALEGAVFVAGAAVQWLRDGLAIIANAAETDALARSVPDTGGVVFVPAFVGLGAPYWDQHARGTLVGVTRSSGRSGRRWRRRSAPSATRTGSAPSNGRASGPGAESARGIDGEGAHDDATNVDAGDGGGGAARGEHGFRPGADRERAELHHAGLEVHPRRGAEGLRGVREGEVERDGEGERDPGGHADRVWAHRRVEGQTRGRHLLGRRIGAVRKARGAKAPAEGRHLARGVGVDSRVDRQAQTDPAQGPGRLLDRHRARAVWPGLSPQEDPPPRHPRAEGLGRSAAAQAQGRGRAVRAHALVVVERDVRSDPLDARRGQGLGLAQKARRQYRAFHRAQPRRADGRREGRVHGGLRRAVIHGL